MVRSFRVWDNQEKSYSDKAFSIDQLGLCYVQDEDGYWEEINEDRYIVEFDTGVIDKNANRICVGDIVNTCCGKARVYFDEEYCSYKIQLKHGTTMPLVGKKSHRHLMYEVIGNINENPELLGGRK